MGNNCPIATRWSTPVSAFPNSAPRAAERPVPARMAEFIQNLAASNGGVTREDLLVDFTAEQIDKHLEQAKQIARRSGRH
jgi:hypothetical protein